jgi:hypothetical protein
LKFAMGGAADDLTVKPGPSHLFACQAPVVTL